MSTSHVPFWEKFLQEGDMRDVLYNEIMKIDGNEEKSGQKGHC